MAQCVAHSIVADRDSHGARSRDAYARCTRTLHTHAAYARQTLADAWFLDYRAARRDRGTTRAAPPASLGGSSWRRVVVDRPEQLLLNRSDHAAVLRPQQPLSSGGSSAAGASLLLFGGLYTEVSTDTIYIMKDFLEMELPAPLAPPASNASPAFPASPAPLATAAAISCHLRGLVFRRYDVERQDMGPH